MSSITKIYVVRHGQSVYNRDGIVSGHVDPVLTEEGRQQAAATKQRLKHVAFDEVYSSDLQRAVETASIIFGAPVPKSHQLFALRERSFGDYDGRPSAHLEELRAGNRSHIEQLTDEELWRYSHHPTIESDHEVSVRFVEALAEIAQSHPGKTILVGAHGGTIRTSLIKLGYATAKELPGGSFDNAGYVELIYQGGEFSVGEVVGANRLGVK